MNEHTQAIGNATHRKPMHMVTCRCCQGAVEGKGVHVKYAIGSDIFCKLECRDGHEAGTCRCEWN